MKTMRNKEEAHAAAIVAAAENGLTVMFDLPTRDVEHFGQERLRAILWGAAIDTASRQGKTVPLEKAEASVRVLYALEREGWHCVLHLGVWSEPVIEILLTNEEA